MEMAAVRAAQPEQQRRAGHGRQHGVQHRQLLVGIQRVRLAGRAADDQAGDLGRKVPGQRAQRGEVDGAVGAERGDQRNPDAGVALRAAHVILQCVRRPTVFGQALRRMRWRQRCGARSRQLA